LKRTSDVLLNALIVFVHEKLGLAPNAISVIGLALGLAAAAAVVAGSLGTSMILLAVSQIVDGLDGGVARRYTLQSKGGKLIEAVVDRSCEIAFFLALVFAGLASLKIALLAAGAILLVSAVEPYSGFDPGFKRFMMYFGYALYAGFGLEGFEIALQVVFFANLAGFAAGTVMADYRFQARIDAGAIIRRDYEIAAGIPRKADDPPSFLSKLFS